ncbi:sensor domain-containing diguanylate cyclase [Photobacterium lipolyticum]|nr:sensor domain-containing diguanylate cyclase [Photobacterium lipolyticum]
MTTKQRQPIALRSTDNMNQPLPVLDKRFQIDSHYGVVVHRNFKPLYADDNYARTFGFDSGAAILAVDSLLELIAPHEHETAVRDYEAIMAGRDNPGIHTYRNIGNDGTEFIVLTVDHVIDWQGEPAMQITVMDLSAQFDTLQQLHDSERRYRELVDGSIQGILVHRDFRPLFCNQAFAGMFGFDSPQALLATESILPLFSADFHQQARKNYHSLVSGRKNNLISEIECQRIDGKTGWLNLLSRPITWNGGQAIQVTAMDISRQHQLRKQLEYRANYDGLTELLNRRATSEILEAQLVSHRLQALPLCCVLIDLDDFKAVNDRFGHCVGDEVLRQFAVTCRHHLRQTDFVGRWGGEEFILVLPNTIAEQARILTERLRQEIASIAVATSSGEIGITVCMGIADLRDGEKSAEPLLSRADRALYAAKHNGKNRVELAEG